MDCPRAEAAIETCDAHVESSSADPEIEVILAQHVASVAYAEFEALIKRMIHDRCKRHGDDPLSSFIAVAAGRLIRSIKITELSGSLGWFGDDRKKAFSAAIDSNPEAVAAWNNVLTGRHGLAHEQLKQPTLTLSDVKRDVRRAQEILDVYLSTIEGH
jgi:hypothetical protein